MVPAGVLFDGGEHADGDGDDEHEDEGSDADPDGQAEALAHEFAGGAIVLHRVAHVALHEGPGPFTKADQPVFAKAVAHPIHFDGRVDDFGVDVLLGKLLAQSCEKVARREFDDDEADQHDHQHDDDHLDETLQNVGSHGKP